jgi:hypothetical protein
MTVKRALTAGIAAGAVVVGAGLVATNPTAPSLPDVQVPAVQVPAMQLSNAEGMDPNALWLDLFTQASGNNLDSFGTNLPDSGPAAVPGQTPLIVIDPQDSTQDFDGILDELTGKVGNPLDAVNSAINGPDAATHLTRSNGS